MMAALAALAGSFAAGIAVERLATLRGSPLPSPAALPARLAVLAVLYAVWLGIWGRPYLAGMACLVTLAIMVGISIRKRQLVGEPLAFSDFGLLRLIVRHPDLYYTDFMSKPPFWMASLAFAGALGVWLWLEPAYRLLSAPASFAVVLAVLGGVALLWLAASRPEIADRLRRVAPVPKPDHHLARWGLLLSLCVYALRWRADAAAPCRAHPDGPGDAAFALPDLDPALVVIVQFESFLDPVRIGFPAMPLPGLVKARELALLHGPLLVPAHGAFTMRSEHAVLTGLSDGDLGFRFFDPYLARRGPACPSLAAGLAARGFRTVFMHPFRPDFFGRDSVIPRLGFETVLFEEDFVGAERFGPYVSDRAMALRILSEADRAGSAPTLVAAVTMENHGPWTRDRLAEEPDPTRQYLLHLRNADLAIAALIDGLSELKSTTVLCVFGDHPPILPGVVPTGKPETDYAVLVFGPGAQAARSPARPLAADELGRALMQLCGLRRRDAGSA